MATKKQRLNQHQKKKERKKGKRVEKLNSKMLVFTTRNHKKNI